MRAFICAVCCVILLGGWASAHQQDSIKPRKKKQVTATPSAPTPAPAVQQPSDARVGTTKSGQVVYRGKKGGYYVLTPSGRKRYVKAADVILDEPK